MSLSILSITDQIFLTVVDLGDPISAPPGPFTIQPHVLGRFLWLTGAPGLGKSTTAQILGRQRGWNTVNRWTEDHILSQDLCTMRSTALVS